MRLRDFSNYYEIAQKPYLTDSFDKSLDDLHFYAIKTLIVEIKKSDEIFLDVFSIYKKI